MNTDFNPDARGEQIYQECPPALSTLEIYQEFQPARSTLGGKQFLQFL